MSLLLASCGLVGSSALLSLLFGFFFLGGGTGISIMSTSLLRPFLIKKPPAGLAALLPPAAPVPLEALTGMSFLCLVPVLNPKKKLPATSFSPGDVGLLTLLNTSFTWVIPRS